MEGKFEDWKRDIENRASEVVEPSADEIDKAVYDAAARMGDVENIGIGERPIEVTIKELEAEGWHYRGPVSGDEVFKAVAEEKREVRIVGTGTERFIFERDKESD